MPSARTLLPTLHLFNYKSTHTITTVNHWGILFVSSLYLSRNFQNSIKNFRPDFTSPILTTSNLTLLKLYFPNNNGRRYTLSRFSQVLHQHPNLQELDLEQGGTPAPELLGSLVPFVLPQLVDLHLYSMSQTVMGFINLIDMSTPLHNITIHFQRVYSLKDQTLAGLMKKILAAYYGCSRLSYPYTVNCLTILSAFPGNDLIFDTKPHSTSVSHPTSNFKL